MTSSYFSRSLENWKSFKDYIFFSEKKTWAVLKTVMLGPYWPWRMPIICTTGTLSECHPAGRHQQGVQLFMRYFINLKISEIFKEESMQLFTIVSNPADQRFLFLRVFTFSVLSNCQANKNNSNVLPVNWLWIETWENFGLPDLNYFGTR